MFCAFLCFGSGVAFRGQLSGIGSLSTLWILRIKLKVSGSGTFNPLSHHASPWLATWGAGLQKACYLHFKYVFFSCSVVLGSQLLHRSKMWLTWGLGRVTSEQASVTACCLLPATCCRLWWPCPRPHLQHTHKHLGLFRECPFHVNFLPKSNLKLLITETRDRISKDQWNIFW